MVTYPFIIILFYELTHSFCTSSKFLIDSSNLTIYIWTNLRFMGLIFGKPGEDLNSVNILMILDIFFVRQILCHEGSTFGFQKNPPNLMEGLG